MYGVVQNEPDFWRSVFQVRRKGQVLILHVITKAGIGCTNVRHGNIYSPAFLERHKEHLHCLYFLFSTVWRSDFYPGRRLPSLFRFLESLLSSFFPLRSERTFSESYRTLSSKNPITSLDTVDPKTRPCHNTWLSEVPSPSLWSIIPNHYSILRSIPMAQLRCFPTVEFSLSPNQCSLSNGFPGERVARSVVFSLEYRSTRLHALVHFGSAGSMFEMRYG